MTSRAGLADGMQPVGYRSSTRPEVLRLLPPLRTGIKTLEVGCGEGAFSMTIPDTAETWGIEPEVSSATIARDRLSTVLMSTFEEASTQLPRSYFDLVICNDVIEHMSDHVTFLNSIRTYMRSDAYLIGSVPNVRFYRNLFNLMICGDWHYQNAGVLDRTHFRFFTFKSFRRSLEDAGFQVKRLEGINPGPRYDWRLRTLAERLFRKALIVLSLGMASDTKYLQIGFLAVPGLK